MLQPVDIGSAINDPAAESQVFQLLVPPFLQLTNFASFRPLSLREQNPASRQQNDTVRHPGPARADPFEAEPALALDRSNECPLNISLQRSHELLPLSK